MGCLIFLHFMVIFNESHFRKSMYNHIPFILCRCDPYGQTLKQSKRFIKTFNQLNWFSGCCTSSPGHPQEAGAAWQLLALDCKGGGGHGGPLARKNVDEGVYEGPVSILHWPSSCEGCFPLWRWQQRDNRAFGLCSHWLQHLPTALCSLQLLFSNAACA